jgi:ATP-dependent Lon protease
MKRRNFIVNDDKSDNSNDSIDSYDYDRSDKSYKSYKSDKSKKIKICDKNKYDEIKKEMELRDININNILELNLSMDDYIWFIEYFKIVENCDKKSEELYKIKKMIYDKYISLKNTDCDLLKKIKNNSGLEDNIIQKIIHSNYSDDIKTLMYKKYKRCSDSNNSDELFKIVDWIDIILDLPIQTHQVITNKKDNNIILTTLWKKLNDSVFGLTHVKEKVMETMCSKILNSESNGKILTLVGPPGVGKTAMALSIAQSMNMPFDQISFGSIKDSSMLTGHASTYIGSSPGLFTKILLKSKRLDTVILLDEIDKIPNIDEGKSISSVLLHVLDKTQNSRFRDMYIPEIHLDLSNILFICAANSITDIEPILRDRMNIIEINGYDLYEKINIVKKHLFPKIKNDLNIPNSEIIIDDKEIKYLIEKKIINSFGMREIERKLYELSRCLI